MWKKINKRYELVHTTGSFDVLLKEIDKIWSTFITHNFYTEKQRNYIGIIKEKSTNDTYANVQMDFAQSYGFVIQQEIQCAYYFRQQASIFTVYIKIDKELRNIAIISDSLLHDAKFVYASQMIIVDFLRKEYPNIKKINYITDGAIGHFKSKFSSC